MTAKPRAGSDHVPLILDLGIESVRRPTMFRFEKWWLEQPDFKQLVSKIWNSEGACQDAS